MGTISTQSIFQSTTSERTWRSYIGSIIVHTILILLVLTVTIPVIHPVRKRSDTVTLIAPVLREYKVKTTPPRIRVTPPITVARVVPKVEPPKLPDIVRPKPVPQKPVILAAAPEIKVQAPQPLAVKPDLPAVPKPAVQTGVFQQAAELAKNMPAPQHLEVGGFGDPRGVTPSAESRPGPTLAKIGAFDAPTGGGTQGGGGHSQEGVKQSSFGSVAAGPSGTGRVQEGVKQSAFGAAGVGGAGNQVAGTVKTSGFNDSAAPQARKQAASSSPAMTPVEIISKPRPAYTQEARGLKLEGQVSLEVVFLSTGSIRVVRVLHGLGHGLDEAAQQAAQQVRFKPAMRGGVPVDTNATISITFELT